MTDARALYNAAIVERDRGPRHEGPLPTATHEATVDNPLCGDSVTMRLVIADGVVAVAAFEGRACALARAGADFAADRARGATPAELRALATEVEAMVHAAPDEPLPAGIGELAALAGARGFKSRRSCACLAFRALAAAVAE